MKLIILGNSGAGKSTLSKKIIAHYPMPRLSLDEVAFNVGSARRPIEDSVNDVKSWISGKQHWIIEGCYADILLPILDDADELVFLNPGMDICIRHCQSRPWEPEKFSSKQAQDDNLNNLINWIRSYADRQDEYGLISHRALFNAFSGKKREFNHPDEYHDLLQFFQIK